MVSISTSWFCVRLADFVVVPEFQPPKKKDNGWGSWFKRKPNIKEERTVALYSLPDVPSERSTQQGIREDEESPAWTESPQDSNSTPNMSTRKRKADMTGEGQQQSKKSKIV